MTKRFINATAFDHMDLVLAAEMQNTPFVTMSEESNRLRMGEVQLTEAGQTPL